MTIGTIENVIKRAVGDRVYFFGTIGSDKVKHVTFVPTLEKSPKTPLVEDLEGGYQRPGSMARMNKFKNFLKDNPSSLVPPVLLSGRGNWKFTPKEGGNWGTLEIKGPAAILDGQHRLGGYVALFESDGEARGIDFLLLDNLSRDDEIREFVIVNNTQVGVPKSLNMFIAGDIEGLEGVVGDFSDEVWISWQLNLREDSPFQGRITRTKLGPEHLFQLASVAKNIDKMFSDGAFANTSREKKLEISTKYWNLIADLHPKEWADIERLGQDGKGRKSFEYKLLELTGFIAWSQIGATRIVASSYNAGSDTVDWDRVQKLIDVLHDKIDWRKDGEYDGLTGEVGGPRIRKDMELVLSQNPI